MARRDWPAPTGRARETLVDLDQACRSFVAMGQTDWVRPLDCGGSDSSDHSYYLAKLVRAGLAEAKQRAAWTGSRGSKLYRITEAGRLALAHPAADE